MFLSGVCSYTTEILQGRHALTPMLTRVGEAPSAIRRTKGNLQDASTLIVVAQNIVDGARGLW